MGPLASLAQRDEVLRSLKALSDAAEPCRGPGTSRSTRTASGGRSCRRCCCVATTRRRRHRTRSRHSAPWQR